ncbi:ATP-dependent RNA helicase CshB [Gracilibacillus ureilyticus]|uniref:ATP-dependent RNA helicase CshB n=1 Tax=Gracilibacillus ureilyticus TaxID=531814 RepID=A0A1H9M2U7_9BACI|nr:DEAD/DEAH box helicase [Gracilibacillus ureilyticus]SER17413.1 ATP-dependent RNA helicase CshB [Gracilibacillus ureilyticus]
MKKHLFKQYALEEWMYDVIGELGFYEPTPIQSKVIPEALHGKNIIGQSETGSGKTHAFLIPLLNNLDEKLQQTQVILTAPTRELAIQIYDEVKKIMQFADKEDTWRAKLIIGGTDKKRMIEKIKEPPHIIVATPGRLLDLLNEDVLDIYAAKAFVMDETDLMLELGLIDEIDRILSKADPKIQVMVFSATIPEKLQPFLKKYLHAPKYIKMDDRLAPENMEHRMIHLKHREPANVIYQISTVIHPYLAIIFTNGKEKANELADQLQEKGLNVGLIHGGLSQRERKRVLKEIQQLKYQYIVATDLAARGIDIKGVSHVINAELPKEESFYIHRVGRTARAGMEGTAINLYTDQDIELVKKLEKKGITYTFYDIVKGEWQESKAFNARQKRAKHENETEKQAWKQVRKPKSVKPGYKKKMKQQQLKAKKKIQRNTFKKK